MSFNLSPELKKQAAESPQQLVPSSDQAGPQPAFANEDYNKVARAAKLRALMLTKSTFFVLPDFILAPPEEHKSKISYGSEVLTPSFNMQRGLGTCEWKWSVMARTGRTKSLCIEAHYRLIYDELSECKEEAVIRFMSRVGRFATYPYFRAHVSQVSWESNANIPILPVIAT